MKKTLEKVLKLIPIYLLIGIAIAVNILFYNYIMSNNVIEKSGQEFLEREEYEFSDILRDENDYIEQRFHPQREELNSIKIRLAENNGNLGDELLIQITLYQDDIIIKQEEVKGTQIKNWRYYDFIVDKKVDVNQEYSLIIKQLSGPKRENSEKYWISYVIFHGVEHVAENERYYFYNGEKVENEFEVCYIYSYRDKKLVWKQIIVNIGFIIVIILYYGLFKVKVPKNIKERIIKVYIFLLPIFSYIMVEGITGNLLLIKGQYLIKNLLIYYLLLILLSFLIHHTGKLITVYLTICMIFALVQYFVSLLRGKVFMLQDIFSWKTALTVIDTYSYEIPYSIFLILMIFICNLCICIYIKSNIFSIYKKLLLTICIISIMGISKMLYNGYLSKLNMWDLEFNYRQGGLLLTLISEIPYFIGEKPKEYNIERVKAIIDKVEWYEENREMTIPENMILIMNESFADLEYINEIFTSTELLPYIKNMNNNTIKGYLHVPVFGGGTANTEYEVLSGNSMSFLTSGSTAYQMNVHDNEYGLVSNLKALEYHVVAFHPYLAKNWNRDVAYQYMGFDEFYSQENWGKISYIRWCASDKAAYEKVIEIYEKTEKKFFAFLVTMQNHGGYGEKSDDLQNIVKLDYENTYPQTEQYLSLLQESDKAFEELITYFSNVEEATMIIMFGDHQASIEEAFYEELFGKSLEELSFEEKQKRYVTPFIIWTNYEIEEKYDIRMSTNYFGSYILSLAGLKITPYNQFLLNLWKEIPIIGSGGICDKEGIWYQWDELPEYYKELIEEYKILQYNNVYDRKNRIDEIFTVK